jgi:hypothetical protein
MNERRLTGRQLTIIAVALCAAVVLAPAGAIAAGSLVKVTDGKDTAQVTRKGALVVGDPAGPLTVDGATRTQAPRSTLSATGEAGLGTPLVIGPTKSVVNLTSLTVSDSFLATGGNSGYAKVEAVSVPLAATSCGSNLPGSGKVVWQSLAVVPSSTLVVTFPTPLQLRANAGSKLCVVAYSEFAARHGVVSLSGFYGD